MAKMDMLRYSFRQQYSPNVQLKNKLLKDRLKSARSLFRKDLFAHYGCVNAIEFSPDGDWLVSGGDDRRVLLWNVEEAISGACRPRSMKGKHNSNIFCLSFDSRHNKVFSAGNDEQVIEHDVETGKTLDVFLHGEAVYGISVEPMNDNVFASACDDGRVLIWDVREPASTDPFVLISSPHAFHAVMYNPAEPRLVATANSKEGVGLWDVRKPKSCLLRYDGYLSPQSSMSVRYNSTGTLLLALRRRLPPVLYHVHSPYPAAEFDHSGYYNSCTMKSCCFAGDSDQYVLSGSDDFKLYMWKIPEEVEHQKGMWVSEAHLVLKDHRSIVNQVRYNNKSMVFASSGVEKIIKLWSTFPLPDGSGSIAPNEERISGNRKVYSYEEYVDLVMESGQFMTHDYSHQSMKEDPRMMAFFDSLVQRDIEGWTSDSSNSSTNSEVINSYFEVQSEPVASSSSSYLTSSPSSSDDDDANASRRERESSLSPQTFSYFTMLANRVESRLNKLQNSGTLSDDKETPSEKVSEENSVDRITQLISKKRKEQFARVAQETLKMTAKRLKRSKKTASQVKHKRPSPAVNNTKENLVSFPPNVANGSLEEKRAWVKHDWVKRKHIQLIHDLSDSDLSSDLEESSTHVLGLGESLSSSTPISGGLQGNADNYNELFLSSECQDSAYDKCTNDSAEGMVALSPDIHVEHLHTFETSTETDLVSLELANGVASVDTSKSSDVASSSSSSSNATESWTQFKRFKNGTKTSRSYRARQDRQDSQDV